MERPQESRTVEVRVRAFYVEHVGLLSKDQHVHHTCENPWCLEPTHLEAVTFRQHVEAHRYTGLTAGFNETAF